jgi:tryptophan synthase alpha chain
MPFFACGHPDIETTRASCIAAREAGADIVELGIPFSDPIADGPVIQSAFASALRGGFRVRDAFRLAESLRRDSFDIPLVAMVSYSLIFRAKTEVFARDAAGAGFDGLIVPDLPFDADESFREVCRARGLATVPLVAPTTPPRRRAEIVRSASGFIYYVSVAGITGERDRLPPDLARNVRAIKAISSLPVCVGFGISRPEHAAAAGRMADGVIVGSALVKRISEMASSGVSLPEAMRALAADIRLLAEAAHGRR